MAKTKTTFAPLLSATYEDKYKPNYPVLASPKFDGIRLIMIDGNPMTRSLKDKVKNLRIQSALSGLPGFDGELLVGNPADSAVCARTQSVVMSRACKDEDLFNEWRYYIFDLAEPTQAHLPFEQRYLGLHAIQQATLRRRPDLDGKLVIVKHEMIRDEDSLFRYEDTCVEQGYEGIMIRSLDGYYKWGRATAKERILTKLKRWEDAEGVVVDVHEEMHNGNEVFTNPLGKAERSSHQENMVPTGRIGGYTVRTFRHDSGYFFHPDSVEASGGNGEMVTFFLGATANVTREEREELWKVWPSLIGKDVTYKYQFTRGAEKPRFPSFKIFREKE